MNDDVRALRLWHWRGVMHHRNAANFYRTKKGYEKEIEWRDRQADFHLKAVQTLNQFFEAGDTAEKDDTKDG